MLRRILAFICALFVCFTVVPNVAFATGLVDAKAGTIIGAKEHFSIIKAYMKSIESQDTDALLSLYAPAAREAMSPIASLDKMERPGILAIDTISISEIKEVMPNQGQAISPYIDEYNSSTYKDVRYFYIGFLIEVCKETEFFSNGVMYEVFKVGQLDGVYYILDNQYVYDFDVAVEVGCAFNSEAERQAAYVQEQRAYGNYINFYGDKLPEAPKAVQGSEGLRQFSESEILEDQRQDALVESDDIVGRYRDSELKALLEQAAAGANAIRPMSMTSAPSQISVGIVNSTGTGLTETLTLTLDAYVKQVLPNEWKGAWKTEALRAGALACKTYGWYNVEKTRRPARDFGVHVTNQSASYQKFVKGSNYSTCDTAVNYVSGTFLRNSSGQVFDARHSSGSEGNIGPQFTGELYQWGTQYIATNFPEYDKYTILSYYYSLANVPAQNLYGGYIQIN